MKVFKKATFAVLAASLFTFSAAGCGSSDKGDGGSGDAVKVTVSGSTSVGPLMEKEAEAFKGKDANVKVEINQIGSSAGIKNAIDGVSEFGMASRDLKEDEKSAGLEVTEIAYDGIALVMHPSNEVKDLTLAQIKDIYTGKITNWKEVGGKDSQIVVVSREDGSGTRGAFEEIIGFEAGELVKSATIGEGSGNIKTTVSGNENAIGYISFEYLDESVKTAMVDGVEPKVDNVLNKTYKVSRPFILVHKADKLSEKGKEFIDFILSEEGQKVVEEAGSIPLSK